MKEIASELRKAVIEVVSPIEIDGITIPIFDERVNPSRLIPIVRGSNSYIIIRDQIEVETTNDKCQVRQNANITIDIVTKFPLNSGGKLLSEIISGIVQESIFRGSIQIQGFNIINVRKASSRGLVEQGVTLTAYRKIITYVFDVFEDNDKTT
jgi:hypothetical protein